MQQRRNFSILALLVILIAVNWSVYQQEKILAEGKKVLLKLRVVDPRSLMQGDYMALDFELAEQIRQVLKKQNTSKTYSLSTQDAYVVVHLDENNVAEFVRLDNGQPLADDELRLFFRVRNGEINFATNAFFFEEGTASMYESATLAEFRVADDGNLLLVGLQK